VKTKTDLWTLVDTGRIVRVTFYPEQWVTSQTRLKNLYKRDLKGAHVEITTVVTDLPWSITDTVGI
jgi:hypothetical protein